MRNRPSQSAASTLQPFRLLDLPRELFVPIVRSFRPPIPEYRAGPVIYRGEKSNERYGVLRDLCLTHRDILPFAQEELFKRLHIRSNKRMSMLNRSIASSERCKGYASRTESIFLRGHVNADKLMKSEALNPREIFSITLVKFSTLNRFQNLRRINLVQTTFDMALELPNLEIYSSYRTCAFNTYSTRAIFNSDDLPNLRRLILQHGDDAGDFGHLYDSIIPQLDHLALVGLYETELEHLLFLSTSLQSLCCHYVGSREGLVEVLNQIVRIDVKKLHLNQILELDSSDDWETDFKSIEKLKKLVEVKDKLKWVKLSFIFEYEERPLEDVCDRSLARWNGIKDELESMCSKKGIEVVALTCALSNLEDEEACVWNA